MPPVPKPPRVFRPHFLQQWREFVFPKDSMEAVAPRLGISRSTLSRVEKMEIPYNQHLLEAASEVYKCQPWDLLNINPKESPDAAKFANILYDADRRTREKILAYAEGQIDKAKD